MRSHPLLVILGPTACGKTDLAVHLARRANGEILSADSRQVYRGLDLGAGKDLSVYSIPAPKVPYHLIDIADLDQEFNLFQYQLVFRQAYAEVLGRGRLPILVGGSGLYLEAILLGYDLEPAPVDPGLRARLAGSSDDELCERLQAFQGGLHNTTDTISRERMLRALEIAQRTKAERRLDPWTGALVLGIHWERARLRERIARRLQARLDQGLVEEVKGLIRSGVRQDRLKALGLEYRYVTEFVDGRIVSPQELFATLNHAIADFAKRQETWFRRMERRGVKIHWLDGVDEAQALTLVQAAGLTV